MVTLFFALCLTLWSTRTEEWVLGVTVDTAQSMWIVVWRLRVRLETGRKDGTVGRSSVGHPGGSQRPIAGSRVIWGMNLDRK